MKQTKEVKEILRHIDFQIDMLNDVPDTKFIKARTYQLQTLKEWITGKQISWRKLTKKEVEKGRSKAYKYKL